MAVKKNPVWKHAELPALVVSLAEPGMTPLLRCGVGGLAASLRAIGRRHGVKWPVAGSVKVPLGPGSATVEPQRIVIDWGGDPESTLGQLMEGSFVMTKDGLVDLPGARFEAGLPLPVQVAQQDALKRTILQHGKSTTKKGGPRTTSIEIDERSHTLQYQPYSTYAHQENGVVELLTALRRGSVELAGWAYPGAAVRHTGLAGTSMAYSPACALAAFFVIVGSLSLLAPGRSGVLVILAPRDLLRFSVVREHLTPRTVQDSHVSGANDAVLSVSVALRQRRLDATGAMQSLEAVVLRATPWDKKQKYRVSVARSRSVPDAALSLYERTIRVLETRLVAVEKAKKGETNFFASPSVLREFVAANLAVGRRWFDGFSIARSGGDRFIHYYRSKQNKGALSARERDGLEVLTQSLEEAEVVLVKSVHIAIRQRLGAIAEETAGMTAKRKRWDNERERWRLAFAQSKTHEQVRSALADLWSRAGSNSELKQNWQKVLPLLREQSWQAARDLALVALASYRGNSTEEDTETSKEEN